MKTKVYHADPNAFGITIMYQKDGTICSSEKVRELWNLGRYRHVANVTYPDDIKPHWATNHSYQWTNHISRPWWENEHVAKTVEGPCRSTSVGDVMEHGGQFFVVASLGFDKIELDQPVGLILTVKGQEVFAGVVPHVLAAALGEAMVEHGAEMEVSVPIHYGVAGEDGLYVVAIGKAMVGVYRSNLSAALLWTSALPLTGTHVEAADIPEDVRARALDVYLENMTA